MYPNYLRGELPLLFLIFNFFFKKKRKTFFKNFEEDERDINKLN
jgi:hypothetical protein